MGYKSGPIYKTILNHLLEAKLDGKVESRADEIEVYQAQLSIKENRKNPRSKIVP